MTKAAVIGYPISHSKSPLIHNYWIKRCGLKGSYEALEIEPEDLERSIHDMISEGYNGFNVTVPHKKNVMTFCDEIEEIALNVGAVNTVKVQDGKLIGTNTDVYGFIQNLKAEYPDFSLAGKKAFIIGAGGAARAALYGFLQEDIGHIYISNRTKEKAEELQEISPDKITVINWDEKENYLSGIDLLVNTTSLGMKGKQELVINLSTLNKKTIVYDIVYNPLITDLLQKAQDNGNPVLTGIGMLLYQAQPAFQTWFGLKPDITEELKELVLK